MPTPVPTHTSCVRVGLFGSTPTHMQVVCAFVWFGEAKKKTSGVSPPQSLGPSSLGAMGPSRLTILGLATLRLATLRLAIFLYEMV